MPEATLMKPLAVAYMTRAEAVFHTNDDNKDDDTLLYSSILRNDGVYVCQFDNVGGEFPDNTDNGPIRYVINAPFMKSDISNSRLGISIRPNGDDTWKFNVTLTMFFSDNSSVTKTYQNLVLSDQHTITWLDM